MILPRLQVDKGAIKFILSGANIMCPGLTSPGARMDVSLPQDTVVVSSSPIHHPNSLSNALDKQLVTEHTPIPQVYHFEVSMVFLFLYFNTSEVSLTHHVTGNNGGGQRPCAGYRNHQDVH